MSDEYQPDEHRSEQHGDDLRLDRRLAELYHGGAREEPPGELNRRILAAAQAASPHRRRRWPLAGLATAAVAVLAVIGLLRPTFDAPSFDPGSAAESRSVGETVAPKPPAPGRASRFEQPRRTAQVEEIVVTTARSQTEAAAEAVPEPAADAADATAPSYAAAECPEPYPLPPGAAIRSVSGGIEVTVGDTAFTLRCRAGSWQREPAVRRDR